MNDLDAMRKELLVDETTQARNGSATGTPQWFLEDKKNLQKYPIHNGSNLQFLICDEGFKSLAADIEGATRSIDIFCWGFDPAMELGSRNGGDWPRGKTYGDLLADQAKAGRKVRLLMWYPGDLMEWAANNAPDIPLMITLWGTAEPSDLRAPQPGAIQADRAKARKAYVQAWWKAALRGGFPNLEIRTRRLGIADASSNLQKYLPGARGFVEQLGLTFAASHHQKGMLIDYMAGGRNAQAGDSETGASGEDGGGPSSQQPRTCGYVMGLNSVTDYWDTSEHLYNDRRRELNWGAGASDTNPWTLKPLRDYACRIEGDALHTVNANFMQAWDEATAHGPSSGSISGERSGIQPDKIYTPHPQLARMRAQIVRTYPAKGEAAILHSYVLATGNAVNYIYVENQYFSFSDWARLITTMRGKNAQGMGKAGKGPGDSDPLYLFLVIPQPEKSGMVPQVYETVKELGQARSMSNYDDYRNGVKKKSEEGDQWTSTSDGKVRGEPAGADGGNPDVPSTADPRMTDPANPPKSADTSDGWETSGTGGKEGSAATGDKPADKPEANNLKVLLAMLMSYDYKGQGRNMRISKRDNAAQDAEADQERKKHGRAKDEDPADAGSTHKITPRPYREIYIHSKLMFIDDAYTTLGSANLSVRSMASDSEMNLCTEEHLFTSEARRRVWGNLAGEDLNGGSGGREDLMETHKGWSWRMNQNKDNRKNATPTAPVEKSFIHPFEDSRAAPWVVVG